MTEQKTEQRPAIDVTRVVKHLNLAFSKAIRGLGRPARDKDGKPNDLYKYQVEFSYMIDEIQRGPVYQMPKVISEANEMIAKIMLEKEAAVEAKEAKSSKK